MLRWLNVQYLLPLIFIIGLAQYGVTAIQNVLSGNVVMWTMDSETMESAGPLRYVKDAFLLILAFIWPIYVAKLRSPVGIRKLYGYYFVWLPCIALFGVLGIAIGYSPPFFLAPGFRWLMLLHSAVGVFFLMRGISSLRRQQSHILWLFIAMAVLDALVILMQIRAGASIGDVRLAGSRLTGMFNNAGIAAFFGFSIALCGMCLTRTSIRQRATLTALSLFIAFASGTRSMMILIFVIFIIQINAVMISYNLKKYSTIILFGTTIFFSVVGWLSYQSMIDSVGRGGILETQLGEGGRISNFFGMLKTLYAADYGELLIGRGIGIGTNTAYGMLKAVDIYPEMYRFNWLIDNSFLTQFFQFGAIGSLLFWAGIFAFLYETGRKLSSTHKLHHRLASSFLVFILFAGNPFEHYFLIMGFSIAIGLSFWGSLESSRASLQKANS